MKATATLTSKGQVTIPKAVREVLGVRMGDSLEFDFEAGRVEMRATRPKNVSAGVLRRYLPKSWKAPSVEEMNEGMARALAQKHRDS